MEMNKCMRHERAALDIKLNETYRELIGLLAEPKYLRSAQKNWLAFRDSSCSFAAALPASSR